MMQRHGYLFRQLLKLLAAVFVPLVLLLGYNVWLSSTQAESSALHAVDNYAIAVSQDLDTLLDEANNYLEYLSTRPLVMAMDEKRCDPVLEGVVKRRRHFANVLITNLEGRPVCTSIRGPGAVPETYATFPWFKQAGAASDVSFSKPFMAPIAQRMVSAMSRPVLDAAGLRVGTVSVLFDLASLRDDWVRYPLPPNSRLNVFDHDGTVMVTSVDFDKFVGTDASAVVRNAMARYPGGVGTARGIDGIERVFALKPVARARWSATAAIPSSEVFAASRKQVERSLAVTAAVLLVVVAFALAMAKRMVAPLTGLARTAKAVAAGRNDVRAAADAPGEFGLLAEELNGMLDARQAATAALVESERRFADLLANVDMVSMMVDSRGIITYCNDFMVSLTGWSREELTGQHWLEKLVPGDKAGLKTAFERSMNGAPLAQHFEHEMLTRSGTRRLLQWHTCLLKSTDGSTAGLATLGVDVTEARAAREREVRQLDFYSALSRTNGAIVRLPNQSVLFDEICRICVEHGHASIAYVSLVDEDRIIKVASAGPATEFLAAIGTLRAVGATGYPGVTGAAVNLGTRVVVNDCDADDRTLAWRMAASSIGTKSLAAFPLKLGEQTVGALTLHMTTLNFFDEQLIALGDEMAGDISFALGNFARESARTLAETKLAFQQRQLAGLVDTAMDAIISIDASSKVVLFNRAAAELFLVSPAEAIGSSVDRFIPSRLHAAHHQHVNEYRQSGSTARRMGGLHTLVAVRADGCEFPIEASISKLDEGSSAMMTVVIRDATAAHLAERSRIAQAEAESANRAKTSFLSKMSHELRTPLNAVLGFSHLLQQDGAEPLSPRQRQLIEYINGAGAHLLALIDDVLDVTRIETGKISVEERSVELVALLDEAVRLNEGGARERNVRLVPQYRVAGSTAVQADPRRLKQVMINLLSNAIKYNTAGGKVEIAISEDGVNTVVSIDDTGLGMNASQMAHLYEPFNRLGRERAGIEGTGLGLAVARELVQLMHGDLRISSVPGTGTHVEVSLPTLSENAQSGATVFDDFPEDDDDTMPNGVVLYIEDNPVNIVLVEQLLLPWSGVTLLTAENGAAGLALAGSAGPDLILLDMRLPDMDGVEVLGHLFSTPATRGSRVVALSASAMPEEVEAAMKAGASYYWTKPLDFAHFLRGMRNLLRKS